MHAKREVWEQWLVETRYFSLGEQYYSTAGANWTRMAKELFVRSWYRNGQCSRSNGRISMRLGETEAVICIFGSWKYQVWENSVARERDPSRFLKKLKIFDLRPTDSSIFVYPDFLSILFLASLSGTSSPSLLPVGLLHGIGLCLTRLSPSNLLFLKNWIKTYKKHVKIIKTLKYL